MKKVIIAIVAFFVAAFVMFGVMLGIGISKDSKQLDVYRAAMEDFQQAVDNDSVTVEKIRSLADEVKSEGDYARVEKAAKEYLRDVFVPFYVANELQQDGIYAEGVSLNLLTTDGPEFAASFAKTNAMLAQLDQIQATLDTLFTRDAALEYLGEGLDEYYVELFETEVRDVYEDVALKNSYEKYIATVRPISNQYQKMMYFLKDNGSRWRIEDGKIIFTTTKLTDEFNRLSDELGALGQ